MSSQRVEAAEREEEVSSAKIAVKKKKTGKGKSSFRQTKLASASGEKNSLEVTKPSAFAEGIDPVIPEFNANPKKTGGGRKKAKTEPTGDADGSLKEELKEETVGSAGQSGDKKADVVVPVDVLEGKPVKKPTKPVTAAVVGKKRAKTKPVIVDDEDEIEEIVDSDDMDVRN